MNEDASVLYYLALEQEFCKKEEEEEEKQENSIISNEVTTYADLYSEEKLISLTICCVPLIEFELVIPNSKSLEEMMNIIKLRVKKLTSQEIEIINVVLKGDGIQKGSNLYTLFSKTKSEINLQ